MALFGRNPNEAAYTGGKKHWADVIKNTGPGELLIWRQPEEDFNTNSTLIVMPGEEAIFIKGGNIEEVFGNTVMRDVTKLKLYKSVAMLTGLGQNTVKDIDKERLREHYTIKTKDGLMLRKPEKQAVILKSIRWKSRLFPCFAV